MKQLLDLCLTANISLGGQYALLRARPLRGELPAMSPGQFAQLRVDGSPHTLLRRPISIHFTDREKGEVSFLVRKAGAGTTWLAGLGEGSVLNAVLPLGKGYTLPAEGQGERVLLVGGGVGCAPLLFLGSELRRLGSEPVFLLGARSEADLLLVDEFRRWGSVLITTEDGSAGERGLVTDHSVWREGNVGRVCCCGPKPMMVAVARKADALGLGCEVSLENMMACGLGACLCCVEETMRGNVCVCTEGPVFDIKELRWQI